jgi:hypothetical protein
VPVNIFSLDISFLLEEEQYIGMHLRNYGFSAQWTLFSLYRYLRRRKFLWRKKITEEAGRTETYQSKNDPTASLYNLCRDVDELIHKAPEFHPPDTWSHR